MKRAIVVAAAVLLASVGFALRSDAQSAVCSRTTLAPGQHIGVTGDGATPGTTVSLEFNGSTIGAGTADGFGNFALSGTIPGSATPGLYPITVTGAPFGTLNACTVSVEEPASTAGTPTPIATSTATQAPPAPSFVAVPVVVQQQQQQQQQVVPVPAFLPAPDAHFVSSGRSTLPTTGFAAGEFAQGGTGALIIGFSLIEFARRRRRNWLKPQVASGQGSSEGDLFLPYWPR